MKKVFAVMTPVQDQAGNKEWKELCQAHVVKHTKGLFKFYFDGTLVSMMSNDKLFRLDESSQKTLIPDPIKEKAVNDRFEDWPGQGLKIKTSSSVPPQVAAGIGVPTGYLYDPYHGIRGTQDLDVPNFFVKKPIVKAEEIAEEILKNHSLQDAEQMCMLIHSKVSNAFDEEVEKIKAKIKKLNQELNDLTSLNKKPC